MPSDSTRVEVTKLEFLNFNSRHLMVKKRANCLICIFSPDKKAKKVFVFVEGSTVLVILRVLKDLQVIRMCAYTMLDFPSFTKG